jgi:pimeloyl-ACP methyl ester carboxylesterase
LAIGKLVLASFPILPGETIMDKPVDYAFLHGGGQGGWVWDETIAALQVQTDGAFGRALALDVPGCGQKRDRDTTVITSADVVNELLDDIGNAGMRDVVLVGHSQAGTILPLMAGRRPELFRRLVYVSCAAPPPDVSLMHMMGSGPRGSNPDEVGFAFDWNDETLSFQERMRTMFCNDMSDELAESFLAKLGMDMWPDLVTYGTEHRYDHLGQVPSTYVLCLEDTSLPLEWQERFATRFKADDRIRIDAGHQVMNTLPHGLAEILRRLAAR